MSIHSWAGGRTSPGRGVVAPREAKLRGALRPPHEPAPPDVPNVDGRRQRSERSRERILDAVEHALSDPGTVLTPEGIATRAGVSLSSIFRHFGQIEGLATAIRERIAGKVLPYFMAGPFEGNTRTRVRELLRRRSAIYEIVSPLQHAALRQPRQPPGARETQEHFNGALLAQIKVALASELRNDSDATHIVEALLSLGAWTHLRVGRGLGVEAAAALLERAVLTQLGVRAARR